MDLLNIFFIVGASALSFTIVILLLAGILMYAKSILVPSGELQIVINGDENKPLTTSAGSNLLSTLAVEKIFIPSACGGGGTCGMCKCQVLNGGGDVLPTEMNHLSRKEAKEKWRIACQVKVKEDMAIKIPEEIFGIKKWECEVVSNNNVATFIKEFIVRLPEGETLDFESGGYVQIDVPSGEYLFKDMVIEDEYKPDWDNYKMWDLKTVVDEEIYRAYSMANHPAEGNIVMLNIRIATPPWDGKKNKWMDVNPGLCSSFVFTRKPGDKVVVSGPYGEFFIKHTKKEMVFIGGGAGMAPMRSHIYHLFKTEKTDRKVTFFYGGRSKRELFYMDDFKEIQDEFPNFKYHVGLSEPMEEDKWEGQTGFIHQVVHDVYLKDHPEPEEIEYYLCGPPLMLNAIRIMLEDLGVPAENIAYDEF